MSEATHSPTTLPRRVVLVGAGHAHLHIVAEAAAYAERNVELLLIDPSDFWYSGLATGMLSGEYSADENRLDPAELAAAVGCEFIRSEVQSVDIPEQQLTLGDGRTVTYDWLSLNIGSEVAAPWTPADSGPTLWPVKPIPGLHRLRETLLATIKNQRQMPQVCVVGGGATGTEIAANLIGLAERCGVKPAVTLVTRSKQLLPHRSNGLSHKVTDLLLARKLRLRLGENVISETENGLRTATGQIIECDHAVLAVGLQAKALTRQLGLSANKNGLIVNAAMQSIDNPTVFAAGDCADFQPRSLAKVGVFGVRAAETIHQNLLASIDDKPLQKYKPQRLWLAILNLGNGTALATWWKFWWLSAGMLRWKDKIDRKFMQRYRQLYQSDDTS